MSSRPQPGVPVTGADPASFARSVLAVRHPALIEQVRAAHPYGPRQRARLDRLAEEITGGPIPEPPTDWPDHAQWRAWGAGRWGRSWFEVPFLWAESYFYRRLLDAVDYYSGSHDAEGPDADGPYRGLDPFEPAKSAELVDLGGLAELAGSTDRHDLLLACVWGNRADLGFRTGAAAQGRTGPLHTDRPEPLLVDDGGRVWQRLDIARRVVLVADNAGRELLADLLLIDHLLHTDPDRRVELHVKPAPYFVSDATGADVSACLRALVRAGAAAADAARRLYRAAADGALRVSAHPSYFSPLDYRQLPADLDETFRAADLVLMKGDLNYRRLVGDELRPVTTPFATVTDHFPSPVAALRTLKSDVVVGLDAGTEASLDATGQPWRTNGTQALIQLRD